MWRSGASEAIGRFLPRPAKLTASLSAQTVIKLPKKKYTPSRTCSSERKPRRKSASSTHHRGPAHREVPHADWQPPRRRGADGTEAIGLRVLVHAGEPERHQRVRAAGRTDVRATRHVRRGRRRSGSRGRDGARAFTRAAAAWNGERVEGPEPVAAAGKQTPWPSWVAIVLLLLFTPLLSRRHLPSEDG